MLETSPGAAEQGRLARLRHGQSLHTHFDRVERMAGQHDENAAHTAGNCVDNRVVLLLLVAMGH